MGRARAKLVKEGGTTFTFVTDGIASVLKQARAAAGDKDVSAAAGGCSPSSPVRYPSPRPAEWLSSARCSSLLQFGIPRGETAH